MKNVIHKELWQIDTFDSGRIEHNLKNGKCIVVKDNQYVAHNIDYDVAVQLLELNSELKPLISRTVKR